MDHEKIIEHFPKRVPPQEQDRQPGIESVMVPRPVFEYPDAVGSGKLRGKVALITGGDSGIGRAVALAFAREGASDDSSYMTGQVLHPNGGAINNG